jgi:hypothetical protein
MDHNNESGSNHQSESHDSSHIEGGMNQYSPFSDLLARDDRTKAPSTQDHKHIELLHKPTKRPQSTSLDRVYTFSGIDY